MALERQCFTQKVKKGGHLTAKVKPRRWALFSPQSENYCLTIILNTRTIQLECDNERHRNDWLEAFQWLLETRRRNRF